jgi:hypothetical protein
MVSKLYIYDPLSSLKECAISRCSEPSISMDFTSMDSANCRLKIFGGKLYLY